MNAIIIPTAKTMYTPSILIISIRFRDKARWKGVFTRSKDRWRKSKSVVTHKLRTKRGQVNHSVYADNALRAISWSSDMCLLIWRKWAVAAHHGGKKSFKWLTTGSWGKYYRKIEHTCFLFNWTFICTLPPLSFQAGEKIILVQTQNGQCEVIHVRIIGLEGECKSFGRA